MVWIWKKTGIEVNRGKGKIKQNPDGAQKLKRQPRSPRLEVFLVLAALPASLHRKPPSWTRDLKDVIQLDPVVWASGTTYEILERMLGRKLLKELDWKVWTWQDVFELYVCEDASSSHHAMGNRSWCFSKLLLLWLVWLLLVLLLYYDLVISLLLYELSCCYYVCMLICSVTETTPTRRERQDSRRQKNLEQCIWQSPRMGIHQRGVQ